MVGFTSDGLMKEMTLASAMEVSPVGTPPMVCLKLMEKPSLVLHVLFVVNVCLRHSRLVTAFVPATSVHASTPFHVA